MKPDILNELRQIQRYATGLQALLADAQAQAPRQADGTDGTGAVRVHLGRDGLPESVRVESDWQRRLAPEAFGGAVGEAFAAAMGQRLAGWTTTLREQGWQSGADRLRQTMDRPTPTEPTADAIPAAFRRSAPPRPVDVLAEDMISAFDNLDQLTTPPQPAAASTGSAANGKLVVTLSPTGGLSCTADPQWVERQSAASLMNALGEALTAAKAHLAATSPSATPAPSGRLDQLLGEAFAVLSDPRRAAGS